MNVKWLLAVCFVLTCSTGWSQANLVPNWSFEIVDSCQTVNTPSGSNIQRTPYWFSPFTTPGAADGAGVEFFFPCCVDARFIPPNTGVAYQQPYDGQNFAGIFLYYLDNTEYVEVALVDSLEANQHYCVRFRYAYSDSSNLICDGLGAYLSEDSLMYSGFLPPPVVPHASQPDSFIVIDTAKWLLFNESFTAQGGERFVTIGNFKPLFQNYLVQTLPDPDEQPQCYLFIDAVEVFKCDSLNDIVDLISNVAMKVSPNPANDLVEIELSAASSTITVTDVCGIIIHQSVVNSNKLHLQTSSWPEGLYALVLESKHRHPVYRKLIV